MYLTAIDPEIKIVTEIENENKFQRKVKWKKWKK